MRRRASVLAAALLTALAFGGCSDSDRPGWPPGWRPQPAPVSPSADSPENALRLLEWCWDHLDTTAYRDLFTSDYVFVFGLLDPDGNAYRDAPWVREDELIAFGHIAGGGDANQPRAVSVTVTLDSNFRVGLDPRYPDSDRWRKLIRTAAFLRLIDVNGGQVDVSGYANFFLVRGDSAAIPEDLAARGIRPDSTRWYVERWEDDTLPLDEGTRSIPR